MKYAALSVLAAALLLVGISHAQEIAPATEVRGNDELIKEKGRFKETLGIGFVFKIV